MADYAMRHAAMLIMALQEVTMRRTVMTEPSLALTGFSAAALAGDGMSSASQSLLKLSMHGLLPGSNMPLMCKRSSL